jgi:hypothetical protein
VKPANVELEKELEALDIESVRRMNVQEWLVNIHNPPSNNSFNPTLR